MKPEDAIDEILANLVWEFQLIANGIELEQHTKSEAGTLERHELEAAKAALLQLIDQARVAELKNLLDIGSTTHPGLLDKQIILARIAEIKSSRGDK